MWEYRELTAVAHCRIVKAEAMMFVTNTVGKNVIIICRTTKTFSLKGLGHVKKNGMKRQKYDMNGKQWHKMPENGIA